MQRFYRLLTVGVCLVFAGCATSRYTPPKPLTGDPLVDGRNAIDSGPSKDKVLWEYRTALAALHRGDIPAARELLDDAITRISNVLGKDPSARKARNYFTPEAKKTFIGEPYERAMAYYYRGVIYWMDGEPDNARACYRSAALEDSGTADEKFASDYVLLDYLDGLASLKMESDPADAYERAAKNARLSAPPVYEKKANLLVFADFGPGPTKFAGGEYAQHLLFRAGSTPIRSVQVQVAGKTYQLRPYDDLYFQATTRGGRVMDHILANKANFKTGTDTVGNVALVGGMVMATQRETQAAGLGLAAFGLLSKLASAATTPEADIRSWDNLPLYLAFAAVEVPPGEHTATIDFLDASDRLMMGMTKKITFTVSPDRDKTIYVSDKSTTPLTQ